MYSVLKRLLVGRPIPSAEQEHQRLIKTIAVTVVSDEEEHREGVVVTSVPYHLRSHGPEDRNDALITRAGGER